MHGFLRGILDFMGYIASLFFPLGPDNYIFIELATFLTILLLVIACLLFAANKANHRRHHRGR